MRLGIRVGPRSWVGLGLFGVLFWGTLVLATLAIQVVIYIVWGLGWFLIQFHLTTVDIYRVARSNARPLPHWSVPGTDSGHWFRFQP